VRLLVIGGTQFVGRHAAAAALARGHDVTLFNRGRTDPAAFPEAEHLRGDRETAEGLAALDGWAWDAALDTCGYVPRVVRASVEHLRNSVDHYTFISTASVYPDERTVGLDESAPVAEIEDPATENVTAETYGPLKVLCEREVRGAFGERALVVRPGYIVGPHDPTDRFTWWPRRVARGGQMLTPDLGYRMQIVDARDLGDWCVRLAEARVGGVYNAVGPADRLTLGVVVAAARRASGADVEPVVAATAWLLANGVTDAEFPLWHPLDEEAGVMAFDTTKAARAGLRHRPIDEIVRDVLAWDASRGAHAPAVGMAPERERSLIERWRDASDPR
jgi:2'-hydroxyisoflavone reductase